MLWKRGTLKRKTETVRACAIGGEDFSTLSRSKAGELKAKKKYATGAERLDAFRNATFKTPTRSNGEGLE